MQYYSCSLDCYNFVILLAYIFRLMPFPVAVRSKTWVYGRSLAGMWVRIPPGAWMSVSCECCVLSGSGLCDGPIHRPEESYRVYVGVLSVIRFSNNPLRLLQCLGIRGQTDKCLKRNTRILT
jgi:hypothetical protein